jgi:arylsulfatase A-like enzyme
VILISIDALRADHLGCYGYQRETSPSIDRFSQDAVLFGNCMVQGTSTLISHASLFTSLIPLHHGASFRYKIGLPEEAQTIAEILRENGYTTISFNDGGQISDKFGMGQGFDLYESRPENKDIKDLNFRSIVDKSISWMEKNADKKFFMFLHTYETHQPLTPKQEYLNLFESDYEGSLGPIITNELIRKLYLGEIQLDDEDKKHIINAYDAEVRSVDDAFGILTDFMKETNLYDNTIIILTSDHGEEYDEHGKIGMHAHSLFNELLHVPFIMKLGSSKLAGESVDTPVGSIDISPTILDILRMPGFDIAEGISLLSLMIGKDKVREGFLFAQRDHPQEYTDPKFWAIMNERWKLYNNRLYDLKNDPGEYVDVSEDHPELKESLAKIALEFMAAKPGDYNKEKMELDEELKKRLRSLGYIK